MWLAGNSANAQCNLIVNSLEHQADQGSSPGPAVLPPGDTFLSRSNERDPQESSREDFTSGKREKQKTQTRGGVVMRSHLEYHSENSGMKRYGRGWAWQVGSGLRGASCTGPGPCPWGKALPPHKVTHGGQRRPCLLWPSSARLRNPTPSPRLDVAERPGFHTRLAWKSLHPSPILHTVQSPPQRKDGGTTIISISF